MPKLTELIDSLNNENAEEAREILKSEALALQKKNSQLYERAKKAEGFEKDNSGQWIKKEIKPEIKPEAPEAVKSNEPDYAKLAFLEQRGLTHPDDQKAVQEEARRLNLPLTDILQMEHIKTRLKDAKDQREAETGMPKGKGRAGSGKSQQDVDYWLAKSQKADGTYETPSDTELAAKVIQARMDKIENANKFSDDLFTG